VKEIRRVSRPKSYCSVERPDLVAGQVLDGYACDPSQGYSTVEQFEQTGAAVYGANFCSSTDAQSTEKWYCRPSYAHFPAPSPAKHQVSVF